MPFSDEEFNELMSAFSGATPSTGEPNQWEMLGVIGMDEKRPFIVYVEDGPFKEKQPIFSVALRAEAYLDKDLKNLFYPLFAKFTEDGAVREILITFDAPTPFRDGREVDNDPNIQK